MKLAMISFVVERLRGSSRSNHSNNDSSFPSPTAYSNQLFSDKSNKMNSVTAMNGNECMF